MPNKYVEHDGTYHIIENGKERSLKDGEKIVTMLLSPSAIEYREQYQLNRAMVTDEPFVFVVLPDEERFCGDLGFEYLARLTYLATYLNFPRGKKESYLEYEGKPMTIKDMKKVMGLPKQRFYNFLWVVSPSIKTDANGEVMAPINAESLKYYIFNDGKKFKVVDQYFIRGKLPSGQSSFVNRIFINSIRELYETATMKQHKWIGMIFALLPYLNKEWNIICWNPHETDIKRVEPLTDEEVCDMLKLNRQKARRTMGLAFDVLKKIKLPIDGVMQYFCGKFDNGDGPRIVVNPAFVYCGHNNDVIKREYFLAHKQ